MKAFDIINQLFRVLPGQTGLFSTEVNLSSLTKTGPTVTAVSAAPHGLTTGEYVYIANAKRKTGIVSITRSGTIATVVTSDPHDLTEEFFETVEIIGANEAAFNGTFPLLTVPNRYTFTITVSASAPASATGTMFLLEPWRIGFNGWVQTTVVNATTFTYQSSGASNATAYGPSMVLRKRPRISGAVSIERAHATYTQMNDGQLWAFVVVGGVTASKSKYTLTDPIGSSTPTTAFRQHLMNDVYIYVFIPTTNSISGRAERDLMVDISKYLFKSILGKTYPSYFVDQPVANLNFKQHSQYEYRGAYYVHEFQFEGVTEITTNDIVEPEVTRAFRDLELNFQNEFDVTLVSTDINLDDEPI